MRHPSLAALAVLVLAVLVLAVSCDTPAREASGVPKPSTPAFTVISAHWTDRAEAYPNTVFWKGEEDEAGLVVVLERNPVVDTLMVHSTDFALAYEDEGGIPRRPCIGISRGMKTAADKIAWSTLGGSVSRYWIQPGESHFAVLFSAPKRVTAFTLQRSLGFGRAFTPRVAPATTR
jgi:hypothetical protein